MITSAEVPATARKLVPVSVTLHPDDIDLLDRLAALEGLNRSAELRSMLAQLRPILRQTVEAFESAARQKDMFNQAAAQAEVSKLQQLAPEIDRIHDSYLGTMARIEGLAASEESRHGDEKPPASNTGVTLSPPDHSGQK